MKSLNKKSILLTILLFQLVITWIVSVYHLGVFPKPNIANESVTQKAEWYPKDKYKINQLLLFGSPYNRGKEHGRVTSDLIYKQEEELNKMFKSFFPTELYQQLFVIASSRWFWGIGKYFDDWMLKEMLGVSEYSSNKFNDLADPFTRQVAYHGLHDVGQVFAGVENVDFGCTVFGINNKNNWVIGRNFDFEAGRIFDEEKVMKWVFPDEGYSYLSVIWAGMVGVVTGVNQNAIYVSMNAAGSSDFVRYGTPSTLVLTKVLQFAKDSSQAIDIIKKSQTFITDIFILVDTRNKKAFRIEKSPKYTEVKEYKENFAITNHLSSERWTSDKVNLLRMEKLTTLNRLKRAETLLGTIKGKNFNSDRDLELTVLRFLRDKGAMIGDRNSIDALIATHAVIYNADQNIIYVSRGPSLVGEFIGFDLTRSFKQRHPVLKDSLPADPEVDVKTYYKIKSALRVKNEKR
ncbi:MAG: C45 family autoproteolytic acyltransferase/hydrolase [Proteobacteria bacterium]|nr:C45 family autoproteolytic acyltransferase/hydrolase [Pseudomonadota bacterium]